eukprot:gene12278-14392_t
MLPEHPGNGMPVCKALTEHSWDTCQIIIVCSKHRFLVASIAKAMHWAVSITAASSNERLLLGTTAGKRTIKIQAVVTARTVRAAYPTLNIFEKLAERPFGAQCRHGMKVKCSNSAVIRLLRISRGLSKDDFQGVVDPKHVFNLENARSGVTLDTLELLASVLKIDPLTLLTVAASLNRGISHEDLLHQLREQGEQLTRLGVSEKWSGEFRDGALRPVEAGRRTPPKKVEAILACRARGMTQKATAEEQGISRATVSRIWQRQSE